MNSVRVEITPGGKASRAEVIIRIVYGIILGIIAYIFGIIMSILWVVNFFTCLLLGARIGADFIAKYVKWIAMVCAYLLFVTDERPPFLPL